MTSLSHLIETIPADRSGRLPVVFNGREPRFLGYANSHAQADTLAIINRVSATYTSRAQVKLPDGKMSGAFFVLHG